MSEQIKPVARYVVTKDGYLIPLEDGNVVYYGDHAETVQQLQDVLDTERMRLAACGVAALQNTPASVADRITPENPYYSASYADVCNAVDREIQLREQVQQLQQRNDDLSRVCALMRKALNTICMETGNEKHCAIATDTLMEEIKVRRGRS